ncbi:MAG: O-antigen ligase family protein [Alicyclobacillaceae bacterium]|nr:O-antigen ligase family protein [Alicyclobacillaceae bacterium]
MQVFFKKFESSSPLRSRPDSQNRFGANIVRWCLYLLLAYPIVDYAMVRYGLPFDHSWSSIVLVLLALVAVVRYAQGYRPETFFWSKFAAWYIVFCLALLIIGTPSSNVDYGAFFIDVKYIFVGLLLPYLVEPEEVLSYLYVGAVVSLLLGLDGVFQYITKVPIPAGWTDVGEHVRTRVFSVFGSPAEFGAHMEMAVPLFLGLFVYDQDSRRRWLYALGAIAGLATLLFTYDRGSWLGLSLAALCVAVFYDRRIFVGLLLALLVAWFVPSIHHRIVDLFSPVYWMKSSAGGRIMRWETAFNRMSRNPLFGVGLGKYGGGLASVYHFSIYSDNYYAKILGESGLVGLVLFVGMHLAIVREMVQTVVRRATGATRYLALGGLIGTLSMLIHSFVENLFEYSATAVFYFLMIGLLLLWGRVLDKSKQ